jgi:hypothetical protein
LQPHLKNAAYGSPRCSVLAIKREGCGNQPLSRSRKSQHQVPILKGSLSEDGKAGTRETSRKTCHKRKALHLGADTKEGKMRTFFSTTQSCYAHACSLETAYARDVRQSGQATHLPFNHLFGKIINLFNFKIQKNYEKDFYIFVCAADGRHNGSLRAGL